MQTIQVILVSHQSIPNITPILDQRSRPDKVVMVVSNDMGGVADNLALIFKPRGVTVEKFTLDDAWDIERIRDQMLNLLQQYQHDTIQLNATCGTKPMSIAAYEVFRTFDKAIFYVHPEQDRLIWMHPADRPGMALADKIKLPEFLQSHGAQLVSQAPKAGVTQTWRELTQELVDKVRYYEPALGKLNYLASRAERTLSAELQRRDFNDRALMELLDRMAAEQLLNIQNNQVLFSDEAARFYVNGGWLEQHVYGVCIELKSAAGIQDLGHSLEVRRQIGNTPVFNELDVAFLQDNRLYVLECKTSKFNRNGRENSKAAETLYKLDSITDIIGGIQAEAMLVSYRKLPSFDLGRAHELGIKTCCHDQLKYLKNQIIEWIKRP